jgi:hypothetical protein
VGHGATLGRDFKHARRGATGGLPAFSGRTGLVVGLLVGVVIGFGLAAVTLRSDGGAGAPAPQPAETAPLTGDAEVARGPEPASAIPDGFDFPEILPSETVDVPQDPAPPMAVPPEPSDESPIDTSPP